MAHLEGNSTPLSKAVQLVLEAQHTENPFPEGMSKMWALDAHSVQALDLIEALKTSGVQPESPVAWELGRLTGISAAVLSQHFGKVVTMERNLGLATCARRQLDASKVTVIQSEIVSFLEMRAAAGGKAHFTFMGLDKTQYQRSRTDRGGGTAEAWWPPLGRQRAAP